MTLKIRIGNSIIEADFVLNDEGMRQVIYRDENRMHVLQPGPMRNEGVTVTIRAIKENAHYLFMEMEGARIEQGGITGVRHEKK